LWFVATALVTAGMLRRDACVHVMWLSSSRFSYMLLFFLVLATQEFLRLRRIKQ
jgi:hypothetical protein